MAPLAAVVIVAAVMAAASAGPGSDKLKGGMSQQQCPEGPGVRGQAEPLALGEKIKVHVNVMGTRLFTHITFEFLSAGSDKTTTIMVSRLSPTDKKIRWSAYWNGNAPPADPSLPSEDSSDPWPAEEFPGGQYTFVVERRPAEGAVPEHMALWLEERPDVVARVKYQEGCDRLRTTTFIGSVSPKFYSSDGLCGRQGMALPVNSQVRVGVYIQNTDLGFKLALRRPQGEQGSSIAVTGIADDRRSWGYAATGPDGQGAGSVPLPRHRDRLGQPQRAPHLPDGEHVFVVARRPAEVAVWLEARPDFVATAPARPDEDLRLEMLPQINRVLYDKA